MELDHSDLFNGDLVRMMRSTLTHYEETRVRHLKRDADNETDDRIMIVRRYPNGQKESVCAESCLRMNQKQNPTIQKRTTPRGSPVAKKRKRKRS